MEHNPMMKFPNDYLKIVAEADVRKNSKTIFKLNIARKLAHRKLTQVPGI